MSSFWKCKSYSICFNKNISIYAICNGQRFNDTLTNDIVSFEQLDPDCSAVSKAYDVMPVLGFAGCSCVNTFSNCATLVYVLNGLWLCHSDQNQLIA